MGKKDSDPLNNAVNFSSNFDQLIACKARIDAALISMEDYVAGSRKISSMKEADILRNLMREIETAAPESSSGEQNWTLADLENVVYEFVNYNAKKINPEFLETRYKN